MGKIKIGSINHQNLVKGDVNLLKQGEILVSHSEGYTILRKRTSSGAIETFVVIPLKDFKGETEEPQKAKDNKVEEITSPQEEEKDEED
jgi:hypothetical protein